MLCARCALPLPLLSPDLRFLRSRPDHSALNEFDVSEDTPDDDVEEESDDDAECDEESDKLECERFLGLPDCCELASAFLGLCSSCLYPCSSPELSESGSSPGVLLSFLPILNFTPCGMSVSPCLNNTAVGARERPCSVQFHPDLSC